MSSLNMRDKRVLAEFFGMGGGYVLNFSDRTFGEFVHEAVDIEIHSDEYMIHGPSKAKKLRAFWEIESDYLVGRLLKALVEYAEETAHETTEKYQSGGSATSLPTSTATGADSSSRKSHIVMCCD